MPRRRKGSGDERARWRRIEELFHRAADLAAADRAAFLDAECVDDPELRRELESLLAADAESGSALNDAISRAIAALMADLGKEHND